MPSFPQVIRTPVTELFKIKHPIILAGMNVAAGPDLASAVCNAGGLGVIGGLGYTPKFLKEQIEELKKGLEDKNAPFGVDLLLPQVGGNARKTNYDYTEGNLPVLIDVIIDSGAKLFVSAVGVPPKEVVDKLHKHGIPYANMIGHPKHVNKALDAGADMIILQGGEGGGHTGDVPLSVLCPRVVDICRGRKSPLTGKDVIVVAAGGIWDGRGLAASLMYGASGVWVGTRFVASIESGAPKKHKEAVLTSTHESDVRTIIFSGRPLRLRNSGTPYIQSWEDRPEEIKKLTSQGIIPAIRDLENDDEKGTMEKLMSERHLLGKAAAVISDILPAKEIVDEMVQTAVKSIQSGSGLVVENSRARL